MDRSEENICLSNKIPRSNSIPRSNEQFPESDGSEQQSVRTETSKSAKKLASRLRKWLKKSREQNRSENISYSLEPVLGQNRNDSPMLVIPPLPTIIDPDSPPDTELSELKYVGTRDSAKASAKAFPNAVFGDHAIHRRLSKHAVHNFAEESEPHSSQCYRHHHLPIINKQINTSGHHRHHHHHGKSHGKPIRRSVENAGTEPLETPATSLDESSVEPMWTRNSHGTCSKQATIPRSEPIHSHKAGTTPLVPDMDRNSKTSFDSQSTLNGRSDQGNRSSAEYNQPDLNSPSVTIAAATLRPPSTVLPSPHAESKESVVAESRGHTVQSRFRQFWVESFSSHRSRTKSENQAAIQRQSVAGTEPPVGEQFSSNLSTSQDPLPPHAYTVTGGSGQANFLLQRLAAYTSNLSSPPSDQSSICSGRESLRRYGHLTGRSNRSGSTTIPSGTYLLNHQNKRRKSPRNFFGRIISTSSIDKSSENLFSLPDPSKLPKEEPVSSLEFTKTKLKNPKKISQKFQSKSGFELLRRKRAGSLSGVGGGDRRSLVSDTCSSPKPFLLDHLSKSEEALITVPGTLGRPPHAVILPSASSSTSTGPPSSTKLHTSGTHQHHRHHHRWHRHGNHGHHKNRQHFGPHMRPSSLEAHTMTRVTESRRYLMFTRSLPFWSAKQYMETHGTGLGDSETYAVLFQHTPCYELIPESAKLIVLDSQLSISKAFKAFVYNGIRATPVWNSDQQSISTMLTVTDFVHMLNMCWSSIKTSEGEDDASKDAVPKTNTWKPASDISDFDVLTIQRWKEYTRSDANNRQYNPRISITDHRGQRKISTSEVQDPISCPASHLPSPSRSRSVSVSSRSSSTASSAASLPSDLPTVPSNRETEKESAIKPPPSPTTEGFVQSLTSNQGKQTRSFLGRLLSVFPEDNLFKALRIISRFRIHHLPVIDCPGRGTGNILHILTPHRLLSYLYSKLPHLPQPRFLQSSLYDLCVGTHGRVAMVTLNTTLREAVRLFAQEHVSAFPVVDSIDNRRLLNLFSTFDITNLVLSGAYDNPQLTIKEWFDRCNESARKLPVGVCLPSNNLLFVIEKLVKTGSRRLIIVNNTTDYRVEGVVTLSDVLRFVVIQQTRNLSFHARHPSVAEVADEHEHEANHNQQNFRTRTEKDEIIVEQAAGRPKNSHRKNRVRVASPVKSSDPVDDNPNLQCLNQLATDFSQISMEPDTFPGP